MMLLIPRAQLSSLGLHEREFRELLSGGNWWDYELIRSVGLTPMFFSPCDYLPMSGHSELMKPWNNGHRVSCGAKVFITPCKLDKETEFVKFRLWTKSGPFLSIMSLGSSSATPDIVGQKWSYS